MLYAVNYTKDFRHFDEVDEIILNHFTGSDYLVEFLPKFVKKEGQRIILNATEIEDLSKIIPMIAKVRNDGFNVSLKISKDQDYSILYDNDIPFFLINFAHTMEQAYIHAEMGVTDIYVVEALGFRMEDLLKLKQKYGVKIRVLPNIAQTITGGKEFISPMQQFWIRPEDTDIYEEYIDVFEIWGTEKLSVLFEIYKQKQWLGNVENIILDFGDEELEVPNTGLDPRFGIMRLNCRQRCLFSECHVCTEMAKFATAFNGAGYEIVKARHKPEYTEKDYEKIKEIYKKVAEIEKKNESRTNQESNNSKSESTE